MKDIRNNLNQDSLIETTEDLLEAGLHIIRLHPIKPNAKCSCFNANCTNAGKHPKASNWRNAKPVSAGTVELLVNEQEETGFGIVLTNEMLVVDVDAANGKKGMESKAKLEKELGETLENLSTFIVESGSGAGSTHYYFRKDADIKIRKKLTKEYPDIDFLSEGAYVVSPLSLHKTGGTYSFLIAEKSNPLKITEAPDELISIIERKEEFIDYISQEAGSCTMQDIESMLTVIDPDIDYDEWMKVCFAVHHETSGSSDGYELFDKWCAGNLNNNHSAAKYPGASSTYEKWKEGFKPSDRKITVATLYRMAYEFEWEGISANVDIDFDGFFSSIQSGEIQKEVIKTEEGTTYKHEDLPEELQKLNGVLGSFVQWGLDVAPKPSYIIELVGAIQTLSTVIGRDFKTDKNDYSNNYFMVVGGSACGKDMIYTMASAVTELIAKKYYNEAKVLANKPTSTGGLYTQLEIAPRTHFIHDEIGHWIKKIISGTSGSDSETAAMVMTLFGRAGKTLIRESYSQQTRKQEERDDTVLMIKKPFVCLTGLTTPAQLADCLNGLLMQNGFMNRFLMAIPIEHNKKVRDFTPKPLPMSLGQWIDAIQTRLANHNGLNYVQLPRDDYDKTVDPIVLKFTEQSFDRLHNKFQDEVIEMMDECEAKGYSDTMSRAYEQAKRLSLTLQLAFDPYSQYIDMEAANMACVLVKYLKRLELNFYDMYYSETRFEAVSKQVTEQIAKNGSKGILESKLGKMKPLSGKNSRERKEVLLALSDSDTINFINENEGRRGQPKRRWYLSEYVKEKADD